MRLVFHSFSSLSCLPTPTKVFFRGITVNAMRGFPMSAAMFLGYELSLKALRGDHTVRNK